MRDTQSRRHRTADSILLRLYSHHTRYTSAASTDSTRGQQSSISSKLHLYHLIMLSDKILPQVYCNTKFIGHIMACTSSGRLQYPSFMTVSQCSYISQTLAPAPVSTPPFVVCDALLFVVPVPMLGAYDCIDGVR
jgi:hypothetical protein